MPSSSPLFSHETHFISGIANKQSHVSIHHKKNGHALPQTSSRETAETDLSAPTPLEPKRSGPLWTLAGWAGASKISLGIRSTHGPPGTKIRFSAREFAETSPEDHQQSVAQHVLCKADVAVSRCQGLKVNYAPQERNISAVLASNVWMRVFQGSILLVTGPSQVQSTTSLETF